jgi:hypothetical protein
MSEIKNKMKIDYRKYAAEQAPPKPKATINSFKSFGYSLNTAVSDIIDNSIAAKANNVIINTVWKGKDSYITITDNGYGMDLDSLINALTPGSKDPEEERSLDDLGRFGMGLKSASFSQAKRLTVLTKTEKAEFIHRAWDLDYISDDWILLNYISDNGFIADFPFTSGTTILWENLYSLVPQDFSNDNERKYKEFFYHQVESLRKHLELIFHKYLEVGDLDIILNNTKVEGWNPFIGGKVGVVANEQIADGVKVKIHILPHVSNLDPNDLKKRIEYERLDLIKYQGFYLYRNRRLLTFGGWQGFYKNDEFSKLARVELNIDNKYDSEWAIDILKSKASAPLNVLEQLKSYARLARESSAAVYKSRGKKKLKKIKKNDKYEYSPIWKTYEKDNLAIYEINQKHYYLEKLLKQKSISPTELKNAINLISGSIPVDDIIYFQNRDSNLNEMRERPKFDNALQTLAKDIYKYYKDQGFEHDKCISMVLLTDPFDKSPEVVELFN